VSAGWAARVLYSVADFGAHPAIPVRVARATSTSYRRAGRPPGDRAGGGGRVGTGGNRLSFAEWLPSISARIIVEMITCKVSDGSLPLPPDTQTGPTRPAQGGSVLSFPEAGAILPVSPPVWRAATVFALVFHYS
jgi:hypothetical protein